MDKIANMPGLLFLVILLEMLSICLTAQVPVFLTPPTKVKFESVDYRNVLHWNSTSNATTLRYNVQWKIYGEPQWLDAAACQGINATQCDLSAVTSDPREWYYARVHASSSLPASQSAWALSPRFSPRWETKISPPTLRLNVTAQGIVVRVKPPRALAHKMHKKLCYKIYVIHATGDEDVHEIECCRKHLSLYDLMPNTEYCIQAQIFIPLQGRTSARSSLGCATTL